jgi:hypothetical protein
VPLGAAPPHGCTNRSPSFAATGPRLLRDAVLTPRRSLRPPSRCLLALQRGVLSVA